MIRYEIGLTIRYHDCILKLQKKVKLVATRATIENLNAREGQQV